MAKKKGRLMLIKIGDGATPTEAFTTLCALTSKTLTVNNSEMDVTTAECGAEGGPLWMAVLDGVKRVSVSGNGLSKKETAEAELAEVVMATPPVRNFQIIVPNFGTFAAAFFVSSVDFGGEQEGGLTFSLSLASDGPVTFTAEV